MPHSIVVAETKINSSKREKMVRNGLPDRIFFGLSLFGTNLKELFSIHFDKGLTEKLKLENLSFGDIHEKHHT